MRWERIQGEGFHLLHLSDPLIDLMLEEFHLFKPLWINDNLSQVNFLQFLV
jgi:hypothetical protein